MEIVAFDDKAMLSEEGAKISKVLALDRSPTSPVEHLQHVKRGSQKNTPIYQIQNELRSSAVSTSDRTVLAGNKNLLDIDVNVDAITASHGSSGNEEEFKDISVDLFGEKNNLDNFDCEKKECKLEQSHKLGNKQTIAPKNDINVSYATAIPRGDNHSREEKSSDTSMPYNARISSQDPTYGSESGQYLLRQDIFLPHQQPYVIEPSNFSQHKPFFDNIDKMFDECLPHIDLEEMRIHDEGKNMEKLRSECSEEEGHTSLEEASPALNLDTNVLKDTLKMCFAAMCVVFSSQNPSTIKETIDINGEVADDINSVRKEDSNDTNCSKSKASSMYQHTINNDLYKNSIFLRHKKRLATKQGNVESTCTSSVDHILDMRQMRKSSLASYDIQSHSSGESGNEGEILNYTIAAKQRPSVPVAVLYMLWCSLITNKFESRNEEEGDDSNLSDKMIHQLFESIKEILIHKMQLLRVCTNESNDKNAEATECLQINHDLHLQYGLYLSENCSLFSFFLGRRPEEQRRKIPFCLNDDDTWNPEHALNYILASCCLSCVNRAKKEDTKTNIQQLQYEYSIEMLPWHLMRSLCYDTVADLLTDVAFVKARLRNLDFTYDATSMHIADFEELYQCITAIKAENPSLVANIEIDKIMTESYGLLGSLIRSKDLSRWHYEDKNDNDDDSGASISSLKDDNIDLRHVQGVAKSLEALGDSLFSYDKQSESMKYYYKAMVRYEHINTVEMYRTSRRTNSGKLYNEKTQLSMGGVLSRVASVYGCKNEMADAMLCYEKALTFFSRCRCENHIQEISKTLASMGELHVTLKEFDSALSCFNEALVMLRSIDDASDEVVADLLLVMGNVRREMGDLNGALELFSESLYSKVVIYGKSHPEVGFIHHIIGVAFCDKQDFQQAIMHFEKALKIRKNAIAHVQSWLPLNDKSGRIQSRELEASESLEFMGKVYETLNDLTSSFSYYEESTNIHHNHLLDLAASDSLTLTTSDIVMAMDSEPEDAGTLIEEIYSHLHDAIQIGFRLCPIGRIFKSALTLEDMVAVEGQMAEILYDMGLIRGAQFLYQMATVDDIDIVQDFTIDRKCFTSHFENSITLRKRRIEKLQEQNQHGDEEVINYERITMAITLYELGKLVSWFVMKNDIDEREPRRLSLIAPTRNIAVRDCRKAIEYFEEAKGILQDSIAMTETLGYTQDDENVYISRLYLTPIIFEEMLQTMAILYRKLDKYDESVKCYNEFSILLTRVELDAAPEASLAISKKEKVAVASKSIGDILFDAGEFPRALESYHEALNLLRVSGADSLAIADALNRKGSVLLKLKKWDDSVLAFNEALCIRVDQLPQDHDDIAETFHSIGKAYEGHTKYEESLDYYKKAQRIMSGRLVDTDTKAAGLFYDLGNIVLLQDEANARFTGTPPSEDDISLALTCLALSRDIYTRNFGEEALEVGNALTLLGAIYHKYGEVTAAISSYKKALRIFKGAPLDQSERIEKTLIKLATSLLQVTNDDNKELFECLSLARELHEEGDSCKNILYADLMFLQGMAHSKFGKTLILLRYRALTFYLKNNFEFTIGDDDDALAHYEDSLRLYRGVLGKNHAISSKPLTKIGAYFINHRNHDKAMKLLQEALQLYYDYNLPNDLICAEIHFNIGIVHCETGELNKAIDSYELSMQIRLRELGDDCIEIAQVRI